jgi:hypothetical protein
MPLEARGRKSRGRAARTGRAGRAAGGGRQRHLGYGRNTSPLVRWYWEELMHRSDTDGRVSQLRRNGTGAREGAYTSAVGTIPRKTRERV